MMKIASIITEKKGGAETEERRRRSLMKGSGNLFWGMYPRTFLKEMRTVCCVKRAEQQLQLEISYVMYTHHIHLHY